MSLVNITVNLGHDSSWQVANSARSGRFSANDAARFWAKVNRSGDNSCWLWTGSRNPKGMRYGQFMVTVAPGQQKRYTAHRFSWALANGPIPDGGHILHHCDNPICVNPAHLFLGNQDLNMKDAASKGRLHVPRPNRRKVSDEQIAQILDLHRSGVKQVRLAERFGVTKCFISQLVHGKRRVLPKKEQAA